MARLKNSAYVALGTKYPQFVFEGFKYYLKNQDLVVNFFFTTKGLSRFCSKLIIRNIPLYRFNKIPSAVIDNLVFHLGLIEMLSYWKATCSPQISIMTYFLEKKQISFLKDLLKNGMGQYFFENKIDFRSSKDAEFIRINIKNRQKETGHPKYKVQLDKRKTLLGIGGGKDSAVMLELVLKNGFNVGCFILNNIRADPAALRVIKKSNLRKIIQVDRTIDSKLFYLNKKGFLNGHTPLSAYLSFLGILLAVLFNYKYVLMGNERSADEENTEYLGYQINHQYSKSFEFEKKFRDYSQKYLMKDVIYFSFLRPLYELQIVKLFSRMKKYFTEFRSCNNGMKKDKWCNSCPKCLFTFISLYPFVDSKTFTWGLAESLLDNVSLLETLKDLVGVGEHKPFECVGTKEEVKIALYLSIRKSKKENRNLPFILEEADKLLQHENNMDKRTEKLFKSWNNSNFLSPKLAKVLKKETK